MITRIGLSGFTTQNWLSVNRTLKFYLDTLSNKFELVHINPENPHWETENYDAVININSSQCWNFTHHPSFPIFFIMNGGAILDQEFLYSNLGKLENTDVLIVNCSSDIAILNKMFEGVKPKILHLPLPVDTQTFKPLNKKECRRKLPIKKSDYIIGFVGRLLPQKNLHRFLETLSELKKRLQPNNIIGIVNGEFWGDHPVLPYVTEDYPHNIQKIIKDLNIADDVFYFPGKLNDEELAIFYNAMDLLIHPTHSLDENFGYVPVEAMSCSIPVIGSAYGGLKDTIVSEKTGILTPTWVTDGGIRMDFHYGIDYAVKLLKDKKLYSYMSQNSVHRIRQTYSLEQCSQILNEGVERLIIVRKATHPKQVKVKKQPAYPILSPILPRVSKPWEHYLNVVSEYVSDPCPSPQLSSYVRLSSSLFKIDSQKYKLMDDAWPAEYLIDSKMEPILEKCIQETLVDELLQTKSITLPIIGEMIKSGLLVINNKIEG